MSFESFYGGRQGASFVIVKQFDGIDIPQTGETVYKRKYLAMTLDRQYFVYDNGFIERTGKNFEQYNWKLQALDGSDVLTKSDVVGMSDPVTQTLDRVPAEGMRQCFEKGGDSTNEVNYGEYVIIDTAYKGDPDNGKVFRRGMNYDYSETNPLAGAEYIGQIVGPKGDTAEIILDHYEDIKDECEAEGKIYYTDIYTEGNEDLVPGSWVDTATGNRQFAQGIEWINTTLTDDLGNVTGTWVGFKIPYTIQDLGGITINPYDPSYRRLDPSTGRYYYENLIDEDPSEYIDGRWQHPFYQKWRVRVPEGIHGMDSTNIEMVHTKTMPEGFKANFAGTPVYDDAACTVVHREGDIPLVLATSVDVLREQDGVIYHNTDPVIYDADESVISCKINYNEQTLYVKKEDCYMDIIRYRETDYYNLESGEIRYYDIGDYNMIQRITLSETGILTAYYSGVQQPQVIQQALRWIKNVPNQDSIIIGQDGTVTVYYNDGTNSRFEKVLNWITNMQLTQEGDFTVVFNNDNLFDGAFQAEIHWVDLISMEEDGTINCYYNNDHDHPAYNFLEQLRWIDNMAIQTRSSEHADEGTGDQKIHVTYNNNSAVIGEPLNYIIETVICRPNDTYPDVPYSHLLVYYADPALRASMSSQWVTYPSTKYPDKVWTEWVDLGDVRGDAGGLHILENVTDLDDLKDGSGNWIPPEQLTDSLGVVINPEGAGWAVTFEQPGATDLDVYCYDYNSKIWYFIGSIDPSASDPKNIIVKSQPDGDTQMPLPVDVAILKIDGLWLAAETMYCAK